MFVDWISCHLVLFFGLMNLCKKEKNRENPGNVLPMVYGKP